MQLADSLRLVLAHYYIHCWLTLQSFAGQALALLCKQVRLLLASSQEPGWARVAVGD